MLRITDYLNTTFKELQNRCDEFYRTIYLDSPIKVEERIIGIIPKAQERNSE